MASHRIRPTHVASMLEMPRRGVWAVVTLSACALMCLAQLLALGPEIPEGTFVLIARLAGDSSLPVDPSNVVYAAATPPVFHLIHKVFFWPGVFVALGFAAHVLLALSCVAMLAIAARAGDGGVEAASAPRTPWPAAVCLGLALWLLSFPVAHLLRVADYGVSFVPHDSFRTFSHRTLYWFVLSLATSAVLLKRLRVASVLLGLGCFMHPTAGLLGLALFMPVLLGFAIARRDRGAALAVALGSVVGVAPALAKLAGQMPRELLSPSSYADWYAAMIKDEADDFSIGYQLAYHLPTVLLIVAVVGVALGAYALAFRKRALRQPIAWMALSVPLAFALAFAIELWLVRTPSPIARVFIPLTPGYRLLSYAFFPALTLLAQVLGATLRRLPPGLTPARLLAGSALVAFALLFAPADARSHVRPSLRYLAWAARARRVAGIDAYLRASIESGLSGYHVPKMFRLSGTPVTYPGERDIFRIAARDREQPERHLDEPASDTLSAFAHLDLMAKLRAVVPGGTGIHVPPYLRYFRDALVNHPVFFQEHHDGNLMMGGPAFHGFYRERMRSLFGVDYDGMPSKMSELAATFMRQRYLSLDAAQVRALFATYPAYSVFVTERTHGLPFRVITQNESFIAYDLRR